MNASYLTTSLTSRAAINGSWIIHEGPLHLLWRRLYYLALVKSSSWAFEKVEPVVCGRISICVHRLFRDLGFGIGNMGFGTRVSDFVEFWYYQYLLVTALYMLESWERAVFSEFMFLWLMKHKNVHLTDDSINDSDCFLVVFIALASCTAYIYLPGHLVMLGNFFSHLLGFSRHDLL